MASKERYSLASEPFFDMPCGVCSKAGRHEEATKTCLDCKQILCSKCLKSHDGFDIMKGHRVLDKATTIVGQLDLPTQMCGDHGGKLIDMFCPQHDRVCCTSCIAIHHRRCDGIEYVPSISAGTRTSAEMKTALKDSKDVLAELQQRKKEREGDKKRLADEKGRSERNVQDSVKRIIACINDLKDKSLHQIREKHDKFQQRVDDDIRMISDVIASLEDDVQRMQSPTRDSDSELFISLKQSKEHGEWGTVLNTKTGTDLKRESLHFNVDKSVEANMKKVESLGELETPFFASQSPGRYKMRLKDDKKECAISDVCSMPDGATLVTDFINQKLKRLDSSYNLVDHCKLPGVPYSICRTGQTEVAITLQNVQTVQFISATGTLTPTKSFSVGENCRGIAYSRGQIFVTCGGASQYKEGPGEVRVYSTDGKLLHKLPQQSTAQQIWSCPLRVAVSPDGTKVIVPNLKHGVVTMDRDGNNVNTNRIPVDNLCVQDQALWFGAAPAYKTIYQINSDGSSLGALLTEKDGIDEKPKSVCYQRDDDRLIVGFEDCDYIKVFKLHRK